MITHFKKPQQYGSFNNCNKFSKFRIADTDVCPSIPYENFSPQHLAFDLIYNPDETLFLQKARENGAVTENGLRMLHFQAEKAWKIWNK